MAMLSSEQLQFFNSQGYIVIDSFASGDEINSMMKRMQQLVDEFDYSSTASIFSTKNQRQLTDDYFFDSVERISFFFEEKAFGDDGKLKQPKQLSLNKVGHALHEIEPAFKNFSSSEKISSLMYSLGYKRPVVMQSMYIFKQPGIGGEVVPHQDNSFLYTEPQTCTGLWLALEDANTLNGCLWAIPGSHKNGLVRRFLRDENGVNFDRPSPSYDQKDFVPIEVKAGSLVVIHGDLIHQSFENQSPKSRHAYSLHVVDTVGCKWAPENWIRLGLLYLLFTTITTVFTDKYHWQPELGGLAYIGLGFGFFLGLIVVARISDVTVVRMTKANNGVFEPEMRLPACIFFACFIPISFFWYGWSIQAGVHWIVPIIGLIPFGFGMMGIFIPIQTYVIDSFPSFAASGIAALTVSRSLFGAFLPLAGPAMYAKLGYGWGNSVLGFIVLALIPAPMLIYKFGGRVRKRFPVKL